MRESRFVSVQARLALVFTLLFVVGVVFLAAFLRILSGTMAYHTTARDLYGQTRQLYQTRAALQYFQRAVNDYELTADYDTLTEYRSSYARVQQSLANLAAAETPDEQAHMLALSQDLGRVRGQLDQVIQAVDAEDWDAVAALDEQAGTMVGPLLDDIDRTIQARSQSLTDLRDEVAGFARLAWLLVAVALPAFAVMVVVVAWTVARQLHAPLGRLTGELAAIQAERFDPAALGKLPERRDEVGYLAREYLHMAGQVLHRQAALQAEAADLRAKIR